MLEPWCPFPGAFYFFYLKGDKFMDNRELKKKLEETARDGGISCTAARKVAKDLGVPLREIGKVCDELNIKIHSCELGCF